MVLGEGEVEVEVGSGRGEGAVSPAIPHTVDGGKVRSLAGITGVPPLNLASIVEEGEVDEGLVLDGGGSTSVSARRRSMVSTVVTKPLLSLTLEDVQSEVEFWSTAVVCYVMGANPPWETLSGYVKHIWGAYGYDKISFLPNGVFLVRFKTMESQQLVLQKGYFLFDNKPLIVRAWEEGSSLTKEGVQSVPIWIRIPGLPLKFWGCLDKLSSLVGKFVRCDGATLDKTRLGYARVLVEVQVDQSFPEQISFLDEKGQEVTVVIEYEWKPTACGVCKKIGHVQGECRKKGEPRKERRPVERPAVLVPSSLVTPLVHSPDQNNSGLFSSTDKHFVSPIKIEDSTAMHSKSDNIQDRNGGKVMHDNLKSDTIATSSAFKWSLPVQENSAVQKSGSLSPSPTLSSALSSFQEESQIIAETSGSQVGYMGKPDTAVVAPKHFGSQWEPQPPSSKIQFNQMPSPSSKESVLRKPDGGSSLIDSTSKNDQFSSRLGSRGTSAGSSSSLPSQTVTGLPVKSTEGGSTTFGKVFKDASKEVSQISSSAFLISSPAALSNSISSTGPLREESGSTSSSVQASHKIGLTSQTYMSTSSQSPQNSAPSPADNSKSDGFAQTATPTEVSFPGLSKSATGASNVSSNVPTERQSTIFTAPSLSLPDSGGTNGPTNTTTIDSNVTSKAPPEMQSVAFTLPFSNTGGTDVPTKTATIESSETTNIPLEKQSTAFTIPPVSLSVSGGSPTGKDNSDATISQEDEMEEVAPETNRVSDFSLGSLAQFGLGGSSVNTTTTKSSPFGVSLPSTPPQSTSSFPFTVAQGQLFRPFGSATSPQQSPAASGFGQPGQIGFGGQQAMGSVLGSFGQSRQIGAAIPGSGFGGAPSAPTGGFAAPSTPTGGFTGIAAKSGGFAGISGTAGGFAGLGGTAGGFGGAATPGGFAAPSTPTGGFAGIAAKSGGFAGISGTAGGFAGLGGTAGGFGGSATPGGGFAAAAPGGGGFGAAANTGGFAAAGGGGGFGGFSSQGTSGFSAFGGGATGGRPPSELFTQMRR